MKRALALYIPFLATDRRRGPDSVPVAVIATHGQAMRVVRANRAAYDRGIRPGQPLAEAKALAPGLATYDDDPAADRRQLESLAVWAQGLSPVVHLEDENTLIVDVTGCARLFDGESNLLRQAIEGLKAQGFAIRGAIADTVGAAWAFSHAHPDPALIVPLGQTSAELAPLPVWSLRIAPQTTAALASVGVETIASLLYLPRSSLAVRFDESLLERIDQALGDLPEVLTPYRPRPVLTSRFRLGTATTRIDLLTEAVRRALDRFCEKLTERVAGVRQVFVTFYCPDIMTEMGSETRLVTLHVDLSQPTRSVKHLDSLLAVLLGALKLPAPADALMLWAREIDPLDDGQGELFATGSSARRALSDLLDRLAARLGVEALRRPRLLHEHQPERAFQYLPLIGAAGQTGPFAGYDRGGRSNSAAGSLESRSVPPGPRPLRLLSRPREIAATAIVPDGPPISFRLNGRQHLVAKSIGPERIETGWWRGPHLKRDYYRVTTQDGRRGWLFRERDSGRWFLHGWFD